MMAAAKEEKRVMMISLMNDDEGMKSSEYNTGNSDTEYILTYFCCQSCFQLSSWKGCGLRLFPLHSASLFLNDAVLAAADSRYAGRAGDTRCVKACKTTQLASSRYVT